MPSITVRNVPDEVHRALKVRAALHGRSAEAEIRDILANAVKPRGRKKLGTLLAEIGRRARLLNEDIATIEQLRDKTPAKPMRLPT